MTFDGFCRLLASAPPADIPEVAAELLLRPEDWSALVARRISRMDDVAFVRTVLLGSRVPGVTPKPFVLHEDSEAGFQVVLNDFDKNEFDALMGSGRIHAHHHHFPFATRILRGGYHHWTYANQGDLRQPRLKIASRMKCVAGDVGMLPYDAFHLVLAPQPDTLTLVVRGRAVFDPGYSQDPWYTEERILGARSRVLGLLDDSGPPVAGRRIEFQVRGEAA